MQRSEELGLFVYDEDDNETILLHRITSDDIYRKQEGNCSILWSPSQYWMANSHSFVLEIYGGSFVSQFDGSDLLSFRYNHLMERSRIFYRTGT